MHISGNNRWELALFIGLRDNGVYIDSMITTYKTAVTDSSYKILGEKLSQKKVFHPIDVRHICDERSDLNKKAKLSNLVYYITERNN